MYRKHATMLSEPVMMNMQEREASHMNGTCKGPEPATPSKYATPVSEPNKETTTAEERARYPESIENESEP